MTARISKKLLVDLQKASAKYHFSYSEIARKACRKFFRLRPDLSTFKADSTYEGIPVRFDLIFPIDPDDLRRILTWYLALHDLTAPAYEPPEIPPHVAIVISEP